MQMLEKHDLWDFKETKVVEPINRIQLAKYKRKTAKASHPQSSEGLLDPSHYYEPHITMKTFGKEMFDTIAA